MTSLKSYRKQHNIPQAHFADLLGVTRATVSRYECGTRPIPAEHALAIEKDTDGKVRAVDLRPSLKNLLVPSRGAAA